MILKVVQKSIFFLVLDDVCLKLRRLSVGGS